LCTSIPGSAPMAGRSASGPGVNTKSRESDSNGI